MRSGEVLNVVRYLKKRPLRSRSVGNAGSLVFGGGWGGFGTDLTHRSDENFLEDQDNQLRHTYGDWVIRKQDKKSNLSTCITLKSVARLKMAAFLSHAPLFVCIEDILSVSQLYSKDC